jgi:hypothetical protein
MSPGQDAGAHITGGAGRIGIITGRGTAKAFTAEGVTFVDEKGTPR